MNERERAWRALCRIDRDGQRADKAIAEAGEGLARAAVRGVLRDGPLLDLMIERLAGRGIATIDTEVAWLLRLALFELREKASPPFAIVDEAVSLAGRRMARAKGFVNAVLRNAGRTDLETLVPRGHDLESAAIRLGHPLWLLRRWAEEWGAERALRIAEANQKPSNPDLFVNLSKISIEQLESIAREREVPLERSPWLESMMRVRGTTAPLRDLIRDGALWPMDEGSAIVAGLVKKEGTVLDLAAAPGGKALVLGLRGSIVTASDRSIPRAAFMQGALAPFGVPVRVVVADGTQPPFRERFDSVLVDAPCSATGTIRKNPEVKWRVTEEVVRESATIQGRLLAAAAELAGREVVYATCSLEPEENRGVVRDFLAGHPEFELADPTARLPVQLHQAVRDRFVELTPDLGTDGFTAAVLIRNRS